VAPLRRLTRDEYDNTIRELLGDTSRPGSELPTEEQRLGFNNNAEAQSVSPLLVEQYLAIAERVATTAVGDRLTDLVGACDPSKDRDEACWRRFVDGFGKRAYRRPLGPDDVAALRSAFDVGKSAGGFKHGLRLALTALLQSAPFLYRVEVGSPAMPAEPVVRLTAWELAARLSYLFWRTPPDAALLAAAEASRLGTREEIAAQAARLLADPKVRDMTADFHEQWLDLENVARLEKDPKAFPAWSATVAAAMQSETRRFVDSALWSGDGTFTSLLTAPFTFANAALGKFYGLTAPLGTSFQKVDLAGKPRGGLLTQGALLAAHAKPDQTHPIKRGAFVRTRLLCQELPAPPNDVEIDFPPLSKTLTTAERFARHRTSPSCSACHGLIDPIGLAFETFDAVGVHRTSENGKPIDARGEIVGLEGATFEGAAGLGKLLAGRRVARACAVTTWFRYAYGRAEQRRDACSLDVLERRFEASGGKLRDLLAALVETDAFLYLRKPDGFEKGATP
jgi:hypothetical protein